MGSKDKQLDQLLAVKALLKDSEVEEIRTHWGRFVIIASFHFYLASLRRMSNFRYIALRGVCRWPTKSSSVKL